MITTLENIYEHRQCSWGKLTRVLQRTRGPVSLQQILDINGVRDAYWALCCWPRADYADLRADVAESVYEIWHAEYPNDLRVRACIDGWRALGAGEISDDEFEKLRHGAHGATFSSSASAAFSAGFSVSASAAASAATSAAAAAFSAAFSAATFFSAFSADGDQWAINEKLMRKFLSR